MRNIVKYLFAALLIGIGFQSVRAANGIIETQLYSICPGDELELNIGEQKRVFTRDTIVYDTIAVTSPTQDSIYVYVINTYPNFIQRSTLSLEIGSSFDWHGQTIDKPGSYQDIHKNVYGCDSAYYLTVTERLPETVFYTVLDTTICEGEYLMWNGVKYTSSDVVYKVKHGAAGDRDSVYILHLTVAPISRRTESVAFTSWPASYRDSVLKKPGTYEFRYIAKSGCDSIITVIANQQVITQEEQATICAGETFSWQGGTYGEAGQYQKVVKTKDGLHDSIYFRLTLSVLPKKRTYITKTICRGGSITFNGKVLSDKDAGVHTQTIKTAGCDSIVQLTLVVAEADTVYQVHQLLDGETYKWNGKDYSEAGVYFYSTTNANGCDSTVQLTLTTKHVARKDTTVYICEGNSYTWHGITGSETYDYSKIVEEAGEMTVYTLHLIVSKIPHTWEEIQVDQFPYTYRGYEFTEPGSHDFKYLTSKGCDSIITVVANKRVIVDEQKVTICPGTTYKWGYDSYQEYGETGIYQVTEKTKDGTRDSIYHVLNLTVRYIPTTYVNATICQGESYSFGGATLFKPGMYTHKFKVDGCDSTVVLSLNMRANDTILRVHQVQESALPLTWGGHYWTSPGIVDEVNPNQFGCDSVTRFILTTHHVDTVDTVATICQGETLVWHGITARETYPSYTSIETLPNGDQVIYRLNLTVKTAKEVEKQLTMCQGTSVSFNGKTYTQPGTYYDKYNCDTIFRVVVKVNPVQVYVTNATLVGSSYTWKYGGKEKVLMAAGTYTETIENEAGCIDTYRLILKKDDTPYYFEENVTVCEGEDFVWHGKEGLSLLGIGTTTDYTDEYQTVGGKDSIYTLHLTVLPLKHSSRSISFCSQFEWKGKTYTESAVVYDTVPSSTGCDSIIRVYLDKSPTYLFHDTVTIVQGEILNWYGQQINQAGLFRQPFTTVNGCDSIYELGVGLVEATQQLPIYTTQRSICEGDVFTWDYNRKEYSVSGTYIDTVPAASIKDPDTVYILNLKVWPVQLDTIVQHLYACGGENMIRYNGVEYTKDTAVITKYRTIHNCDSIVKTFLHFNTALFQSDTLHLADNDTTRFWHGQKINHSGTYRYEEKAEGECYNREELVVFMHTTYRYVKDTAICQTEIPYRWLDGPQEPSKLAIAYAHEPGITKTYEHKYKTQEGYDSIYVLNLTIYPTYELRQQIHLCENESRSYNGKNYYGWEMKADSLYRDTIRMSSKDNCDSILFMEIIMHPVKRYTETKVLPQDSVLIWNGITITKNGTYTVEPTPTQAGNGCDSIVELRAVFEDVKHMDLCALDTPYTWRDKDYYTSGLWKDTVPDANGQILEVYVLDLTVTRPIEKTLSLRGCLPEGVTFNDKIYLRDTVVNDTLSTCDTIYTLHINVDTAYIINIVDTICEHELPYILGRIDPDTIWQEGFFTHDEDTTMLGCDSTINLTLRIIPSLDRNDSTFVCEDFFKNGGAVYLGDTVSPWFDHDYHGKWEGKWHGVMYTEDTIVYNCDSSHFHHIIMRPSQKTVKDTIVYICPGDTIGFSAFRTTSFDDTTRFVKDTIYEEHVPMSSKWTDEKHHITYNNDAYTCDSITRWHIKVRDVRAKDTTAHKLLGDSIWWNGVWRYHSGNYDSTAYATDTNILGDQCPYTYTLHLIMDTAYYFKDTIYSLCTPANKTHTHIWAETQHKQKFTVGNIDTDGQHYIDSLKTHESRDSIYDLFVIYSIIRDTLIYDTICAGDKYQFHQNRGTVERWLDTTGRYSDTIQRTNPAGCDSIITLQLYVRPSVVTTPKHVNITNRELPYKWKHEWKENGLATDSTDTLLASGLYTFRMPNRFGCDSIDSLYLSVHYTHVFSDTIDTCAPINSTLKYTWATNYVQTFTTPNKDSDIHYYDTLNTRIKLDSIYDLYVHFHRTYETHIYDTICAGDSAFIDTYNHSSLPKRFFKETGIYHDTVPTYYGCDSIFTLHLQVWPSSPKTRQAVHRADVDTPYVWEHVIIRGLNKDTLRDTLYATGEYSRRLENIHGCDSIDSLSLFFHKTWKVEDETINLCKKETPFIWNNQVITRTGDYIYKGITKEGYDSICTVHINVWPQLYDTTRIAICDGDSVLFNGQWIKRAGKYDVVTTSTHGCDSTHTLILTINQPYYRFERQDIYSGETYKFFGESLTVSGTYKHKNTTPAGCDSITELQLVVHPVVDTIVTICANDLPYRWANKWKPEKTTLLHRPGIYHDDTTYVNGERTFWSIKLNVLEQVFDTVRHAICDGSGYSFNGKTYTKAGVYRDTLLATNGCDRIVTTILTVLPKSGSHKIVDIADVKLPYEWEHIQWNCGVGYITVDSLYAEGEYSYRLENEFGCDSIDSLSLRIHKTYAFTETLTICQSETPYAWQGIEDIYTSGTYTKSYLTRDGYDSTYTATITVVPTLYDTIRQTVCRDKLPFIFLGDSWDEGGRKSYTLPSSLGCDSIVTLILTVSEPYYHFERIDIYQGNSYDFFGTSLTTSGTYKHTNTTPAGCDSISELQLVVHPVVDTVVTICANDLPYRWVNKWKPEKVTLLHSPGVYHDDTTYVDGIRTFWSIDLRVNEQKFNTIGRTICQGASFSFNNRNLTKPGTYRDTLTAVSGCDSIVTLILQVSKPQEDTIYQTICAGSSYHFNNQDLLEQGEYRDTLTSQTGCDSIVILKLRVLPTYHNVVTRTIYAGDTVHFHGETYADPGRYQFRHTSASGCDSIIELNLIVNKLFDDSVAVCQSELPYTWHNKEIWKDGIYRDTTLDCNNQPVISGIKVRVLPVVRKVEPIVVTICEGASYPFKGQFLTQQGIYYDTLTSRQFGCDSIITLTLQVIPQSFKSETKSIFEGDSVWFYDSWLKTAGTYVHQEDNGNNCYNTHELVLTVLTAAHRDTTAIVCDHDLPYIWNNVPYYKAGDYEQRTVWNDSAHVITTLHLTVNEGFYGERNVSLCEGSSFIFKNTTYTKKGSFYDTIPSLNGCDSIIKYIISVHPTYDRIDTVHIADKDTCWFHKRPLRLSGTYEWDSVSIHGCDSIEHLILIVHPSFYKFDSIDICQGDTVEWRGYRIAKSGLYSDSLHTQYGFDSVYQVRVNVHQKYFIEQQYEITEGNPTYIHGINISQPGVYYDSLYTIHGCDSVYRVVVNWARTFTQHWDVTICQGEEYKFFGKTLTHSGEYTYNSLNKDSVIYLKLTVNPASITEKRIVIAPDSLPYIYNGRTYEKAGVYADTFINRYKCDSIIRLNLVVTNRYSEWDQIPLCPGQTLKIEDRLITKPGSYTFTKRSTVTGLLDSLYRVEVFAAFDYESPFDTLAICEGDTVMFAGKQLTRGGAYTANLKTVHGCDSILHLFLIVNPSYSFPTKATITDYQSFTWRGKEYNTQGIYTQSYPTLFDCDSTYLLDLTVLPTQRIVVSDSICFRDTLRWRDHILTEPGIYSDTICNLASHTSIIYTLNLGVVTPTIITTASVTETAADVESFKIHFSYSGLRPTSYNIIFDELAHSQGFKDIVNKPFGVDIVAEVPMPKKEKVVYQEHTAYVKPDYYTMRLALDNGVCGLSRSDSLSLLIKYPSWIIEQNWDNVVAPLQPAYNGGYEFGAYKWFINEAEFENDGLPYIYSNSLKPGDRVVLHATRIGESYAIPTAPLVITKPVPDVFPNPVLVYPNATTKAKHSVTLKAAQNGTYFVYSTTGQLFSTGIFETGEQLIDLPATSGCCLIRATTADGFILTEKIIIY